MKVLIVDDDFEVCNTLVAVAQMERCDQVDTATSGEDALGLAIRERYDLVTLDLKLPGVGGLDILSVLRNLAPWAVIAIVTGYPADVSDTAIELADLIVAKPFRIDTIRALIQATAQMAKQRAEIRALGDKLPFPPPV